MTMRSMTGFSRLSNGDEEGNWLWEMRSVNGKGLDLRLRLPQGYEDLDPKIRDLSRKYLSRGNCNFALSLNKQGGDKVVTLNEAALKSAAQAFKDAADILETAAPASLDKILAVKGVLELVDGQESQHQITQSKLNVMADFELALKALVAARQEEGQRLTVLFEGYLHTISGLIKSAEKSPSRTIEAITARLEKNIALLFGRTESLDETRLHQEAILLATRADIEEEIQRLHSHVAAAHLLLAEQGAVGRKFDFLIQEFNREANTLCSKANADDITKIGLALKVLIDQMREQVQNIE